MDASPTSPIRFNRILPYWAVLQTDFRQTLSSWVYRLWVMLCVAAAGGSMLYKVGVHREAGIIQQASVHTGDLVRGLVVGSLALVALLAVSGISGERSTVADAVLSRGISRYQYFLAKLHSRLGLVALTFALLSVVVLATHHFLLEPDLTLAGGVAATLLVLSGLVVVVSWGVTIGALSSGTVIGITVFWIAIYGGLMLTSFLPEPYPTPERVLSRLRYTLRGQYDPHEVTKVLIVAGILTLLASIVGLLGFSRKDV